MVKWQLQVDKVLGKRSSTNFQFDALDGLRGLAVLLVLAGHFSHSGLTYDVDLGGAGTIGVYCFFVLSSFLLATPLIRLSPEKLMDRMVWLNYSARRLLRIYPLYIVLLAFFYILSTLKLTPPSAGLYFEEMDLVKHLFLADAKEYLWTIQVETKFYLVLPLLVFMTVVLLKSKLPNVLLAGAVAMFVSVIALDGGEARGSLLLQFPVFLSGVVGAVIFHSLSANQAVVPVALRSASNVLAIIILLLLLSFLPTISGFVYDGNIDASVLKRPYVFGILWTAFLICVLFGRGIVSKVLESLLLRFIGVISFSVYLWHVPILAAVKRIPNLEGVVGILVVTPIILVVSTLSYLFIEKPFLQIKITKPGKTK